MKVRFFATTDLDNSLIDTQNNQSLMPLEKQLVRANLLIIDELKNLTFNLHQPKILFKVISDRAERLSVIVAINLTFSDWTTMFDRKTMIEDLVGRLIFWSHVLNMNSDLPYRDKYASLTKPSNKGG